MSHPVEVLIAVLIKTQALFVRIVSGVFERRAGLVPRAREGPRPHEEDPRAAALYSRLVPQEEVPEDASRRRGHSEELQGVQREEEVSANEDW